MLSNGTFIPFHLNPSTISQCFPNLPPAHDHVTVMSYRLWNEASDRFRWCSCARPTPDHLTDGHTGHTHRDVGDTPTGRRKHLNPGWQDASRPLFSLRKIGSFWEWKGYFPLFVKCFGGHVLPGLPGFNVFAHPRLQGDVWFRFVGTLWRTGLWVFPYSDYKEYDHWW